MAAASPAANPSLWLNSSCRAGVFLRLLQKQREPLLIKCQLLALLLCLCAAKAREALDETIAFRARQTGQRTKAPETFACDKPLLFQSAEKQGEVRVTIADLLPDALQKQKRLFQRRQMLPRILAGRISCAPAAPSQNSAQMTRSVFTKHAPLSAAPAQCGLSEALPHGAHHTFADTAPAGGGQPLPSWQREVWQ